MMGLESVGGLAIHIILSKLMPEDVAATACISRRFRDWVSDDDSLWSKFCADELGLSSPQDPWGNPTPSFRVSYQTWREAFNMYPWTLVIRAKRCWSRIRSWMEINFPEVLPTLRKGASEDQINYLEECLKVKLPLPTRVLYRFCDGQELSDDEFTGSSTENEPMNLLGLIGGYSFYNHLVNVSLFSLSQVIVETKNNMRYLGLGTRPKYILVAASITAYGKIFYLNCSTGQLHVGTWDRSIGGETLPCVPESLLCSVHDTKGSQQQDAMLLWLEEYGRRLENGIVKVRTEECTRSISHFPEEPPLCSTAMTNGVKVRASAVLVPECCNLEHDSEKYMFAYSIRMSLSPEGCILNGMKFSSCQLYRRRWIIRANDAIVDDISGEAVIGKFPLLRPGEEEFVYESCTPLSSSSGSIEGSFTFVPGRLAEPKGSPFEVEVARFPLQLPDYVF
ncbi:PREDICTED: F-box protein SKIP16 [Ipomoea nil]|uniref:F-box protein SKIP16 n=1 Tax=Ipomoea nil TaxID=35883 RepID=UPI000900C488|nr:PREDICTED: F-box protein SKIP16 [Ipomoea nil]XP_019168397.1 PREDICTED: F-box protein SKIP16 [Ipomoea nil]